jgi:hypothetical protein
MTFARMTLMSQAGLRDVVRAKSTSAVFLKNETDE